jgi:hypothetical protein
MLLVVKRTVNKLGPMGRGAVCAKTLSLSFRSQLYRRGICLPPAAKQQIPRATIPRFGMTILWEFFKLHHYQPMGSGLV